MKIHINLCAFQSSNRPHIMSRDSAECNNNNIALNKALAVTYACENSSVRIYIS